MCPPLPLSTDGKLNAAAASYRPKIECQTLRLPIRSFRPEQSVPRILATSAAHDTSVTSLAHHAGPVSPRGVKSGRLPSKYVAASLPEAPRTGSDGEQRQIVNSKCASGISELYRKCTHHEAYSEPGGVPCRNIIMEYLECTAGER